MESTTNNKTESVTNNYAQAIALAGDLTATKLTGWQWAVDIHTLDSEVLHIKAIHIQPKLHTEELVQAVKQLGWRQVKDVYSTELLTIYHFRKRKQELELGIVRTDNPLARRTWVYVMQPSAYAISNCYLEHTGIQWSEFEGHLWCEQCQKDFMPRHNGVFEGPIPLETAELLGMNFDRINLKTKEIEDFKVF